jgi:hypothetical protein
MEAPPSPLPSSRELVTFLIFRVFYTPNRRLSTSHKAVILSEAPRRTIA